MSLFISTINFKNGLKKKSQLMKTGGTRPNLTGLNKTSPDKKAISNRCCDTQRMQENIGGSSFTQVNKNGGLFNCECTD